MRYAFLVVLFFSLSFLSPAHAGWIMFLNCNDLYNNSQLKPQNTFEITDPICFYGGNYEQDIATIQLVNNVSKRIRLINIPSINSQISSARGYYFTETESGDYELLGSCSEQFICENQDGFNYCMPGDTSCTYIKFMEQSGKCIKNTTFVDTDIDEDQWTDSCDSFPLVTFEWFDTDLDRVGHKNDRDDFNFIDIAVVNASLYDGPIVNETVFFRKNITNETMPGPSFNDTVPDHDTNGTLPEEPPIEQPPGESSGGSGGGGGGGAARPPVGRECVPEYECTFWSECVDGIRTRTCTIINNCFDEVAVPVTEQACTDNAESTEEQSTEQVSETQQTTPENDQTETQNSTPLPITGRVIQEITQRPARAAGISILIVLILLSIVIWRRKKFQ